MKVKDKKNKAIIQTLNFAQIENRVFLYVLSDLFGGYGLLKD